MYLLLLIKSLVFVAVLAVGAYFLVRHAKRTVHAPRTQTSGILLRECQALPGAIMAYIVEVDGVNYHIFKSGTQLRILSAGPKEITDAICADVVRSGVDS